MKNDQNDQMIFLMVEDGEHDILAAHQYSGES